MSALSPPLDPTGLTQALLRCSSVTPATGAVFDVLEAALTRLGFTVERLLLGPSGEAVENLWAKRGDTGPHLCFAGHVDVVPAGDRATWSVDPFAGEIRDGAVIGRGAVDMKGGVGAFIAALARVVEEGAWQGTVSLLITGDEEGVATFGTRPVLEILAARGEHFDGCIVGEPTCVDSVGDTLKVGRRGSINTVVTVLGTGGHVAYPAFYDNPLPRLVRLLAALAETRLDEGAPDFEPSHLTLTTIDVGNPTTNVSPARATAGFNIRFNSLHTGASLKAWLEEKAAALAGRHEIACEISGEAFITAPGPLRDVVSEAVRAVTGRVPHCDTSGGTSDARFIQKYCPVLELGLRESTMHKADEQVLPIELETLCRIYVEVLHRFLGMAS